MRQISKSPLVGFLLATTQIACENVPAEPLSSSTAIEEVSPMVRSQAFESLAQAFEHRVQTGEFQSLTVGAIRDGEIVWLESWGNAARSPLSKASPETPYSIASVGKSLMSLAALSLAEQGKLDLDIPVNELVGRETLGQSLTGNYPTTRQLLAMTGGVPHAALTYNTDAAPPNDSVIRKYANVVFEPGTAFHYSNMSIAMLEPVLEQAAGNQDIEGILSDLVFSPFGMHQSFVASDSLAENNAQRFDQDGDIIVPFDPYPISSRQVRSSGQDLLRLAAAVIGTPVYGDATISDNVRTQITEPRRGFPYGHVSLGWAAIPLETGQTWLVSSGNDQGAQSSLTLLPKEKIGVVVLTNTSGFQADELAIQIADALSPGFASNAFSAMTHVQSQGSADHLATVEPGCWKGEMHAPYATLSTDLKVTSANSAQFSVGSSAERDIALKPIPAGLHTARVTFEAPLWPDHEPPYQLDLNLTNQEHAMTGFAFAFSSNDDGRLEYGLPIQLRPRLCAE